MITNKDIELMIGTLEESKSFENFHFLAYCSKHNDVHSDIEADKDCFESYKNKLMQYGLEKRTKTN